jgi:hypothetical protein
MVPLRASFFNYYIQPNPATLKSNPAAMRFQDWDILLYPKECDVPFREFKTTCYAVQENGIEGAAGTSTPADVLAGLFEFTNTWLTCSGSDEPNAFAHLLRAWRSCR